MDATREVEFIKKVLKHPAVIPTAVGVVSGAAGYLVGRQRTWRQAVAYVRMESQRHMERMENLRDHYEAQLADGEKGTDEEPPPLVVKAFKEDPAEFIEMVQEIQTGEIPTDVEVHRHHARALELQELPAEDAVVSVDARTDIQWDWDAEREQREFGDPFVLHIEEYMAQEQDLPQETFTWYVGDSMLADQNSEPVFNATDVLGNFTDKFGHGSGDPNVVYIRNPDRRMEYEVLRHSGHFSVEVLGEDLGPQE